MSFHPPTDSQWQAVTCTDRHVLVVAGAGSGKTHTVIARILYLLGVELRGRRIGSALRLRDIAAITFTNQGARELKEDLRAALRAEGRREEAYEVDTARIGTIHGFCADLLREHALRTGRRPHGRVLEEGEALALAAQVARDALVDAVESRSLPGLDELLGEYVTERVDGWVIALLRRPGLLRRVADAWTNGGAPPDARAAERALIELAGRAAVRLEATLEREGWIDFDRMVLWTRDLIRDDPLVRDRLGRRTRVLIVDEFQDVDPLQKEIAYLLGDPASGRTDGTRLMLVGDPKQSIYRFRHADVTVWSEVERDFREHGCGEVVALAENFRSVPPILRWADATVGRLLETPVDGVHQEFEVRHLPLRATRVLAGPAAHARGVELILIPPGENGKTRNVGEIRDIEAGAIAARMRELHTEGIAWRDMAVLLAAWTGLAEHRAALQRAGIPHYALRAEGFLETREVWDLVLALETIRDPTDERALFGFLRSPFVAVRDDTLLSLARGGGRPLWRNLHRFDPDPGSPMSDDALRLARAGELLHRYVPLRDRLATPELLDELMLETGYLGHLALLGREGAQAIANVRQFVGMARAMGDVSVGDLLRAVRERRARRDRVAEARLHAGRDDVVTVTSIHVAKGLEWQVVFWADLAGQLRPSSDKLLVGRDSVRLGRDVAPDEQADSWRALDGRLKCEELAEWKRLWYVAATRARDRLILSGIPQGAGDPRSGSFAREALRLFPQLDEARDGDELPFAGADGIDHMAVVRVADAIETRDPRDVLEPLPDDERARSRAAAEPAPLDAAVLRAPARSIAAPVGPPRRSATELLTHARCARRHWFKYTLGIREPGLNRNEEVELVSAVRRGQIVHDVLERWREELELDELLEDAIGRWDENAPPPDTVIGRRYRGHLREEVRSVIDHPDYVALVGRPGARRELDFLHVADAGIVVQGRIDVAAPAAGEPALELLDVKTSQCDADAARTKAAQYAPQRDVYVAAAQAISGLPVRRFAWQFTRAGLHISEELDDVARRAAANALAARSGTIASGAAPLTDHPAECRFCGYRRVRLCPGVRDAEGRQADDD